MSAAQHAERAAELQAKAQRLKQANGSGPGYQGLLVEAQTELLWAILEQGREQ